jgi:tRNA dimethylallyltransferase
MDRWTANCCFLTGPTASGKSELALDIAERLGAEIIAMDSMTLYRGIDIGTSKPSMSDRARVPHHLLDVLDPWESANLAWYLTTAERAYKDIRSRGREPMFVGGTPLYLKALLRGFFAGPAADPDVRCRLEAEGPDRLYHRLCHVDPISARRIAPRDLRRQVRALEVYELTGRAISDWQKEFDRPVEPIPPVACVIRSRSDRYDRINRRVVQMLAAGWIEEVKALLSHDRPLSREARQAVGVREIMAFLRGEFDYDTLVERIQTRTRQLSKRQMTWFRHLPECQFFEIPADESTNATVDRIVPFFQQTKRAGGRTST